MPLPDLPSDILLVVINHLRNIEDFTVLTNTCRTLHDFGQTVSPSLILQLCSRSAPTFFSPHPHFLVAATARRLSRACLGDEHLTAKFHAACKFGIDGLYKFCLQHSGITLQELRQWHLARFSSINPLNDRISKMVGHDWILTEDFWDGGVSEPRTIYCEADRTALQLIIYGELFKDSLDVFLEPSNYVDGKMIKPYFGVETRLEYIKYCIPDWCCWSVDGLEVDETGIYASREINLSDQMAMKTLLDCARWRRMWRGILGQVGPEFWDTEVEEGWIQAIHGWQWTMRSRDISLNDSPDKVRQLLWWNAAVQTGGVEGMKAAQFGGVRNSKIGKTLVEAREISPEVRAYLTRLRTRILSLSEERLMAIGYCLLGVQVPTTISDVPDLGMEVGFCKRPLRIPRPDYAGDSDDENDEDNEDDAEAGDNTINPDDAVGSGDDNDV